MNRPFLPFALPDITEAEIGAVSDVVRYLGAHPVLVDVLPGDHNLDPKKVEAAITHKTIPLHMHPYYRETYNHEPDDFPVALDAVAASRR